MPHNPHETEVYGSTIYERTVFHLANYLNLFEITTIKIPIAMRGNRDSAWIISRVILISSLVSLEGPAFFHRDEQIPFLHFG